MKFRRLNSLFLSVCIFHLGLPTSQTPIKWSTFKHLHKKRFTFQEDLFRKKMFQQKLASIQRHNEKFRRGLESYEVGVNQFSDYTEEELFSFTQGLKIPTKAYSDIANPIVNSSFIVPDDFNWLRAEMVTPVKTQKGCGSCWAFAATGTIESHYKIYHGSTAVLSEQQLIDCVPEATGCIGGWMVDAYKYIAKTGGINYNSDYPYEDQKNTCRYNVSKPIITIKGYEFLNVVDEEVLKYVVFTKGPVSVAFHSEGNFVDYKRGVYYNPSCETDKFTHAGVIVGYGTENAQDYWLLKNSWGSKWGLNGYIKMARNRNNHCGIASKPSYPLV